MIGKGSETCSLCIRYKKSVDVIDLGEDILTYLYGWGKKE